MKTVKRVLDYIKYEKMMGRTPGPFYLSRGEFNVLCTQIGRTDKRVSTVWNPDIESHPGVEAFGIRVYPK